MTPHPSALDPLLLWPDSLPAVPPDDCPDILNIMTPEEMARTPDNKRVERDATDET